MPGPRGLPSTVVEECRKEYIGGTESLNELCARKGVKRSSLIRVFMAERWGGMREKYQHVLRERMPDQVNDLAIKMANEAVVDINWVVQKAKDLYQLTVECASPAHRKIALETLRLLGEYLKMFERATGTASSGVGISISYVNDWRTNNTLAISPSGSEGSPSTGKTLQLPGVRTKVEENDLSNVDFGRISGDWQDGIVGKPDTRPVENSLDGNQERGDLSSDI